MARHCEFCDGTGRGPEYGHEHGDRIWCDECHGSGLEPIPCTACGAPATVDASPDLYCADCAAQPEPRPADWLHLGVPLAAMAARRAYPELTAALGRMLCGAVAGGVRRVVVTTGEEVAA